MHYCFHIMSTIQLNSEKNQNNFFPLFISGNICTKYSRASHIYTKPTEGGTEEYKNKDISVLYEKY